VTWQFCQTDGVAEPTIPFRDALAYWGKLGLTSFGGPAGQISMLHDEVVVKRRWISEKRFLHALNYCMVLPGPEAQQLVTYVGWLMHGVRGGVLAGTLFILPSLVILIALTWLYLAFGETAIVMGIFAAIKPVVVAIIAHAVVRIGSRSLRHPALWAIAGASTLVMLISGALFPLILGVAVVIGIVGSRVSPRVFDGGTGHTSTVNSGEPAIIDDVTPTPPHARISNVRLARTIAVSLAAWVVPVVSLWIALGPDNSLVQMAMFFSGAALLTFGGAYAVLPYVFHGAVSAGWATRAQMVDGLALGETTPGPLIMFVSFVGFVGGFGGEFLGAGTSWASGILAAVVATWFTFLPSFFFILAGGPYVEATRHRTAFAGPLTAINAAVVGVVLSLALVFAQNVFVPVGQSVDLVAVSIAIIAAIALFRFRRSVMEVIGWGAVVGLGMGVFATLVA
jgi:chromate transporter